MCHKGKRPILSLKFSVASLATGKPGCALQTFSNALLAARPLLLQRLRQRQIPLGLGTLTIGQHGRLRKLRQLPGQ